MARRTLLVTGVNESDVECHIGRLSRRLDLTGVAVESSSSRGEVRLQLACADETLLSELVESLAATLGQDLVGVDAGSLAEVVLARLAQCNATLATAESCTGGLVSAWLTEVAGASAVFRGGVVTYTNEAKEDLVAVPHEALVEHGAVSQPVARAMADGVRQRLTADWGIGITGIAGPTGGTAEKPVGLVHWAVAGAGGIWAAHQVFTGDRGTVRRYSATAALDLLRRRLLAAEQPADRRGPEVPEQP